MDNNGEVYLSETALDSGGFEKTNPIHHLIFPFAVIIITVLIVGFLKLISFCLSKILKSSNVPRDIYNGIKRKIFWNHFIRLFIEEYIILSMVCLIKIYALDFTNYFESISSVFAIFLLTVVLVFPLFVWRFLYNRHATEVLH